MKKLFVGQQVNVRNATCDYCSEPGKECAVTEITYLSSRSKYYGGGFLSTGHCMPTLERVKRKIDICKDCARQIANQLN